MVTSGQHEFPQRVLAATPELAEIIANEYHAPNNNTCAIHVEPWLHKGG